MKTLFTGSDVLYLKGYHPLLKKRWIYIFFFRILVKVLDRISEGHYAISERLAIELRKHVNKKVDVLEWNIIHKEKYPKIQHATINIMYRKFNNVRNQKFYDWLTAYDTFIKIREYYRYNILVKFVIIDDTTELSKIFPFIDMYIRFNRWDGGDPPRLVRECINNNIPTFYQVGEVTSLEVIRFIENNL